MRRADFLRALLVLRAWDHGVKKHSNRSVRAAATSLIDDIVDGRPTSDMGILGFPGEEVLLQTGTSVAEGYPRLDDDCVWNSHDCVVHG
eukprot:SAG31_NODE_1595_length_7803_cov_15.169522_3_plen_89_part_00